MHLPKISRCSLAALLIYSSFAIAEPSPFWSSPQHGGNIFNRLPASSELYQDLAGYNASWVRLAYDKWPSKSRDFLIGDADNYQGLVQKDLQALKAEINRAGDAGLKVVVSPLSLPLYRWAQNNQNRFDDRLFQSKDNWQPAIEFWTALAKELKGNPNIAAYNILNEPAPEKRGGLPEHASQKEMEDWYAENKGTSRDLVAFYEAVIAAIRTVDPDTPIMVDAGWYAAADAFGYWDRPLSDDNVLYSFHMYEPYAATSAPNLKRDTPYTYPGMTPFAQNVPEYWGKERVEAYLQMPVEWAKKVGIPTWQLVAGEFGCVRKMDNCGQYLSDVIDVLDANNLHWAFYSFREDSWDAMNYELGENGNVGWKYWQAMEDNRPDPTKYKNSPMFSIIQKKL